MPGVYPSLCAFGAVLIFAAGAFQKPLHPFGDAELCASRARIEVQLILIRHYRFSVYAPECLLKAADAYRRFSRAGAAVFPCGYARFYYSVLKRVEANNAQSAAYF